MSLDQLLLDWRGDPRFMANVNAWRTLPAAAARTRPLPPALDPRLAGTLAARGIESLYTHQAAAVEAALGGAHLAVVTPTASGKTLCYNLPILHTLLNDGAARALYLFPTKALAQDQLDELGQWQAALAPGPGLAPATYDGDTPSAARARIRKTSRLLLTNPDMLHVGILPYHGQWADFLANLRWVVIDEMHTYRGVFGSHVANVLRRLRRLCAHYGSAPQFVATSATIANPQALAEKLVEGPVTLIDDNGAPRGEKHVILLNTPLLDPEKGVRRSATLEASDRAAGCLHAGLQTIVFGRSRLTTELLLTYLREQTPAEVRGYRGGYLPHERRAIEAGLRDGAVRAVVATNALELGIDIGRLQACVVCGYPGSIASTWQQMGRAGRTSETALALLVATAGPLDQYVIAHPEFLFDRSPEHALVNPDNLMLLLDHVRCAAFELPFAAGDSFGASASSVADSFGTSPFLADALALLAEAGDVHKHGGQWFWSGESYPARRVSLRSTGSDAVIIQAVDTGTPGVSVIGEVDHASAPRFVHDGAIYMHEGRTYQVHKLDLANLRADVHPVAVDYYTEATAEVEVEVLAVHDRREDPQMETAWGDVEVTSQVTGYRRIMRHTHTTLGVVPLNYPPQTMATSAWWLALPPGAQAALEHAGLWHDSVNHYGPNWEQQRKAVRARDGHRCTQCGAPEPRGQEHDVHHLTPFRAFGYIPGLNDNYLLANRLENLVLVCRTCHRRIETAGRLRTGMDGLAYLLANLAPLHLMCDRGDLNLYVARSDHHYAAAAVTHAAAPGSGLARTARTDAPARSPVPPPAAGSARPAALPDLADIDFMSSSPAAGPTAGPITGSGAGSGADDAATPATAQESAPGSASSLSAPALSANALSAPALSAPQLATIYLYESIPAGLGFSAALFDLHMTLLAAARDQVRACTCQNGCPACVGPVPDDTPAGPHALQLDTKRLTLGMLEMLLG
jgi:DEAD/DEAH box helicase domain-containing protein